MALKRATYTRSLGQVPGPDEYEGMSVTAKLGEQAQEKRVSIDFIRFSDIYIYMKKIEELLKKKDQVHGLRPSGPTRVDLLGF